MPKSSATSAVLYSPLCIRDKHQNCLTLSARQPRAVPHDDPYPNPRIDLQFHWPMQR